MFTPKASVPFDPKTASVDSFIKHFQTPELAFRQAANYGRKDILRFLAHSLDVNSQGKETGTALHAACRVGAVSIIRLLLELGVRPDILNAKGQTAFDLAKPEVLDKVGYVLAPYETTFKKGDTVVIYTFNTNGIGDAVHAIRTHVLCRRMMPYVPRKTIVSLTNSALPAFKKTIRGDVSLDELYVVDDLDKYEDSVAASAPFILFVSDDPSFSAYSFIHENSPAVQAFLLRSRNYLNLATQLLSGNVPKALTDKTNVLSFLELGGPKNSLLPSEEVPALNYTEVEMGPFTGQCGMMIDVALNDLMLALSAKDLTTHDFINTKLYEAIKSQTGHFAVGYLQRLISLRMGVAALAKKSNNLRLLTNTRLIDSYALKGFPLNQFSQITVYDESGNISQQHENANARYGKLTVFPFEGLDNRDKRRYLMMADSTLGSGDNSFAECLTAGKPFFWDIPIYKLPFVSAVGVLCCNLGLLSLAKLLYLNSTLCPKHSGIIKESSLKGYADFLTHHWTEISSEMRVLRQWILEHADFNRYLKKQLRDPDASPEFIRTMDKQTGLDLVWTESFRDVGFQPLACINFTPQIIAASSSGVLIDHYLNLKTKFYAELHFLLSQLLRAIAEDDDKELKRVIDSCPFIDLGEPFRLETFDTLVGYVIEKNAIKCTELLLQEQFLRGEIEESEVTSAVRKGLGLRK